MVTKRRQYPAEFKREAVRLMESSGKPTAELARELGLNDNNLYRWRQQYGSVGASVREGQSREALEAEIKRLQRENEVLRQEREILKKAMSIVNRSQP